MKLNIIIAVVLLLFIASCGNNASLEQKVAQLEKEKAALVADSKAKQDEINDYLSTFQDIQSNLSSIRSKEKNIEINNNDASNLNSKEAVLRDINAINSLIDSNREKMAELNKRIAIAEKNNSRTAKSMKAMRSQLLEQIEEKNKEIATLKNNLEKLSYTIVDLNTDLDKMKLKNDEQAEIIEKQTEKNNTAFYAITTTRELVDNNVISKKGGVLGIGGTKVVTNAISSNIFSKIDITKVKTLPINSKKVNVISNHPKDSYTFEMKDKSSIESLIILDPKRFWATSKYLVISAD